MSTRNLGGAEREEIELLLPWYVTGRLDEGDRARVEAALGTDLELRQQLDIVRAEMAETVAVNEALGGPAPGSVDRIMARVAKEAHGRSQALGGWIDWINEVFSAPAPLTVRWAAVAALAVILVQSAAIGTMLLTPPGSTYGTAGGGGTRDGSFAIVRFKTDSPVGRVAEVMTELGMTIEDGPKAGGLFVVRIGAAGLSESERAQRLESLRARGEVVDLALDGK